MSILLTHGRRNKQSSQYPFMYFCISAYLTFSVSFCKIIARSRFSRLHDYFASPHREKLCQTILSPFLIVASLRKRILQIICDFKHRMNTTILTIYLTTDDLKVPIKSKNDVYIVIESLNNFIFIFNVYK